MLEANAGNQRPHTFDFKEEKRVHLVQAQSKSYPSFTLTREGYPDDFSFDKTFLLSVRRAPILDLIPGRLDSHADGHRDGRRDRCHDGRRKVLLPFTIK